jgi:hypothetical protein
MTPLDVRVRHSANKDTRDTLRFDRPHILLIVIEDTIEKVKRRWPSTSVEGMILAIVNHKDIQEASISLTEVTLNSPAEWNKGMKKIGLSTRNIAQDSNMETNKLICSNIGPIIRKEILIELKWGGLHQKANSIFEVIVKGIQITRKFVKLSPLNNPLH